MGGVQATADSRVSSLLVRMRAKETWALDERIRVRRPWELYTGGILTPDDSNEESTQSAFFIFFDNYIFLNTISVCLINRKKFYLEYYGALVLYFGHFQVTILYKH